MQKQRTYDYERLRPDIVAKIPHRKIAEMHGITPSTVYRAAKAMGLVTPNPAASLWRMKKAGTKMPVEAIAADFKSGIGCKLLAKKYGFSHCAIAIMLRRRGIRRTKQEWLAVQKTNQLLTLSFSASNRARREAERKSERDINAAYMDAFYNERRAVKKHDNCDHWLTKQMEWCLRATLQYRRRNNKDPQFTIARRLRVRVRNAITEYGGYKSAPTMDIVGCTPAEARAWLESKFKRGMGWHNMGKWHIDHIIPVSAFDLTDPGQVRRCFHFTNMQPLWASENISKGNRIKPTQMSLCV